MFGKSLSENSLSPNLDVAPLQGLIEELDEQNEELLLGGTTSALNEEQIKAPGGQIILTVSAVRVLLFSNPFS